MTPYRLWELRMTPYLQQHLICATSHNGRHCLAFTGDPLHGVGAAAAAEAVPQHAAQHI